MPQRTCDADFVKYQELGAYHWREIGNNVIHHRAFTAERYRRTLDILGPLRGKKVLDYGCGDGALLGLICRRVGKEGEGHGFDPNLKAIELSSKMLQSRRLSANLFSNLNEIESEAYDYIICAEVIEHVYEPKNLLNELHRMLKPGGRAVITTPIRLTEEPEDLNHVGEWFPNEFLNFLQSGNCSLIYHECVIPASAVELYYWRPVFMLRIPVFFILCNLLSIFLKVNSLTWLRLRPRLFMMQIAVVEKAE